MESPAAPSVVQLCDSRRLAVAGWRVLQHLRWSSAVTQGLVLSALTFCVVLPLCCHRMLYSYFFLKPLFLDSLSESALQRSYLQGQEALRFWQEARSASSPGFAQISWDRELLVTVVTAKRREGKDFHYLLQVMRRLADLLAACGATRCADVLLCDVERGSQENEDASLLEGWFRVVRRSPTEKLLDGERFNTFEREKRDYVFCIRKSWELARPRNLLVLEDDALPRPDLFLVLRDLLSRTFAHRSLYIKLYHPERLQRYWNPEPCRLLEWLGLGLLGATLVLVSLLYWNPLCLSFTLCPIHMLFFTLYFMAVVELTGRHYLLELRRLSPQLYAVSPATECCTPAMLFPGNASLRAARYLDDAFCVKGNAKDLALYQRAATEPGERAHSVEPNLVQHIGAFSSIRPNPNKPKLL